jgi:hypothetical protein
MQVHAYIICISNLVVQHISQHQNNSIKDISSKLLHLAGLLLHLLLSLLLLSDLLILPFSVDIQSKCLVILPSLLGHSSN